MEPSQWPTGTGDSLARPNHHTFFDHFNQAGRALDNPSDEYSTNPFWGLALAMAINEKERFACLGHSWVCCGGRPEPGQSIVPPNRSP